MKKKVPEGSQIPCLTLFYLGGGVGHPPLRFFRDENFSRGPKGPVFVENSQNHVFDLLKKISRSFAKNSRKYEAAKASFWTIFAIFGLKSAIFRLKIIFLKNPLAKC